MKKGTSCTELNDTIIGDTVFGFINGGTVEG